MLSLFFGGVAFLNFGYDLSRGLRKRDFWYKELWNDKLGGRLRCAYSRGIILFGSLGS